MDGLRLFRRSTVLMPLAVSLVVAVLGLGLLIAVDYFFVTENLNASGGTYGLFSAAHGVGSLVGAVIAGLIASRIGPSRLLWMSLAVLGVTIFLYSRTTSFLPGLIATVTIGLTVPGVNVAVGPLIYRSAPREYLGRISATINPIINGASVIGMLVGGVLYGSVFRGFSVTILGVHFGPLDTIVALTAVMCILAALYARSRLQRAIIASPDALLDQDLTERSSAPSR